MATMSGASAPLILIHTASTARNQAEREALRSVYYIVGELSGYKSGCYQTDA